MSRCHLAPTSPSREPAPAIVALSSDIGALAGAFARPGVAACVVELAAAGSAPADVRLLPAGSFRAGDGRPAGIAAWQMTDADGARLVAEAAALTSDRVIDYEHATLKRAKASGDKAPAAGWFRRLEWRSGDGLWAIGVRWTAAAAQHIGALEYRYLSPVFSYHPETGRVQRLLHAALTNDPGLDGLTDLAALAAELYALSPHQEQPMPETLKKLLAALGLQESATETEALAAVAALKTNVASLSAQITTPDPAKYVSVATLSALQTEYADAKGQLAALTAVVSAGKVAALVAGGLAAGKLTPATEAWAKSLGESNLAALTAYLDAAPVVVKPGETQSGGKGGSGEGDKALSATELAVCQAMGLAPDAYLKTRIAAV